MKAVEEHFPVSLFGDSKSTSVSCLVYEQTSTFFWFNLKHEGCWHVQTWPLDKASRQNLNQERLHRAVSIMKCC